MRARAAMLAILSVLLALGAVWATHQGPVPMPVIPRAPGHCVLPTATMRRTHMMLLRAVREEIVRHDARDTRFQLTHCVACHVQYTAAGLPIPVNAPGQFCATCHTYVGVHPDCFACHAAVPRSPFKMGGIGGSNAVQAAFRIPRALRGRFRAGRTGGGR